MSELTGKIHSIESFGTVDGPGIRFVVFFQGCPMRCLYCHNPDTWEFGDGMNMTADELLSQFARNQSFYRRGGITATGGEPMAQLPFLTELFTKAKQREIHTCLDTSGICFDPNVPERMEALVHVTDLVMLDIKHIDEKQHIALTGHSNRNILAFAEYLSAEDVPLWIRHVIVPGWTDCAEEQQALGYFLGGLKTVKALDCLPYHTMGIRKYESLGLVYPLADTAASTQEAAADARRNILKGMKKRLREMADPDI